MQEPRGGGGMMHGNFGFDFDHGFAGPHVLVVGIPNQVPQNPNMGIMQPTAGRQQELSGGINVPNMMMVPAPFPFLNGGMFSNAAYSSLSRMHPARLQMPFNQPGFNTPCSSPWLNAPASGRYFSQGGIIPRDGCFSKDQEDDLPPQVLENEMPEAITAMFHFKIWPCTKQFVHDWKLCEHAHEGETAKRRHPIVLDSSGNFKLSYSSAHCLEYKRNKRCSRGDQCPYAHGAWEVGLHPSSYRRRMCFFAHKPCEMRVDVAKKYIELESAQFGVSEQWIKGGTAAESHAVMQEMHLCSSLDSGVTSGSVDEEELELLSVTLAASRLVEESKRKMSVPNPQSVRTHNVRMLPGRTSSSKESRAFSKRGAAQGWNPHDLAGGLNPNVAWVDNLVADQEDGNSWE